MNGFATAVVIILIALPCYFGLKKMFKTASGKGGCGCGSESCGCKSGESHHKSSGACCSHEHD